MSPATRRLPEKPDLQQYKRQAKDLVRAHAARERAAIDRVARTLARFAAAREEVSLPKLRLSDAQQLIALEHGFASWSRIREAIRALRESAFGLGDRVRVAAGPFRGYPGTVAAIPSAQRELQVLVAVNGRAVPV